MFQQFVQQAGVQAGHVDCLSVHFYDTFHPAVGGQPPNPYTSNFSVHSGSNLLAELDLQEAATARLSATGRAMPLLVSEYGGGFSEKPAPLYSAAHDWWVLRGVNSKLMHFLDRPDRILKALPFIVDKALWDQAGFANNASRSYPWVLWRKVTLPAAGQARSSSFLY